MGGIRTCAVTSVWLDTTECNTGTKGGVCMLLGEKIDRELLNLACCHHLSEIMLEKVFSLYDMPNSPNMELFGHLKDFWPRVDQASFSIAMKDKIITPWKDHAIDFAKAQLDKYQP